MRLIQEKTRLIRQGQILHVLLRYQTYVIEIFQLFYLGWLGLVLFAWCRKLKKPARFGQNFLDYLPPWLMIGLARFCAEPFQ